MDLNLRGLSDETAERSSRENQANLKVQLSGINADAGHQSVRADALAGRGETERCFHGHRKHEELQETTVVF